LLIDDVVTTGASIEFAAKTLKQNGAKEVWVAAIARQTLD
jgi:predicted amidophosphoribosyltransferase